MLRGVNAGYELKGKKAKVTDLFLWTIDSLVHTVNMLSKDIGMTFGVDKCTVVLMKRGN